MREKVENPGVDLWHYSGTPLKVSLKSIRHRFGHLSMKTQLNNVWPLLTGRMRACCSVQFSFLFMATKPFTNSSTYSLSIRAFSAAEWWRFFDFFCPQTSWGFFLSFNRRAQSWSAHSLMTSQVTLHSKTSLWHMASMWLISGRWRFIGLTNQSVSGYYIRTRPCRTVGWCSMQGRVKTYFARNRLICSVYTGENIEAGKPMNRD